VGHQGAAFRAHHIIEITIPEPARQNLKRCRKFQAWAERPILFDLFRYTFETTVVSQIIIRQDQRLKTAKSGN
jgi:hypothetical protein